MITTALPAFGAMNIFNKQQETNPVLTSIIKETYMVSMRDDVKLATDVYLPYEGCPPHGSILIRLPYNKDNVETYLNGQGYDLEEWVEMVGHLLFKMKEDIMTLKVNQV